MNFQGLQAQYRRLFKESAAWRLLRADSAPLILAFLGDLFADDTEVPFGRARVALDSELQRCRELGIWETETNAGTYLNQWIRAGWLREMDDLLIKTDASDIAIRFCQGLDQRNTGTTASHLRIVQEAVRDFAVAISPNASERLTLLEDKKAEIQRQIDALNAGVVTQLTEAEQRERIREIYQLASVLTGDFRRVEDEIRVLDQELRVQMIESGSKRGEILASAMEKEALLAKTDAGSAFEGFFQLLCDQNRTAELRDQLRSILSKPVAEQLSSQQQQFLNQLMRELTRESDRVFQIRRRTEEGLRAYVESGAALENRAVDRLLNQLEKMAVNLKDASTDPRMITDLCLPVGAVKITSPESMRLRMPDEKLDTSGIEEAINSKNPSSLMLHCLDTVQVKQVARQARDCIRAQGPMTIASVVKHLPMTSGLEELVAYLRVAKAIGAPCLSGSQVDAEIDKEMKMEAGKEIVEIIDKQGIRLKASIPTYLLSVELFPDDIEELVV